MGHLFHNAANSVVPFLVVVENKTVGLLVLYSCLCTVTTFQASVVLICNIRPTVLHTANKLRSFCAASPVFTTARSSTHQLTNKPKRTKEDTISEKKKTVRSP